MSEYLRLRDLKPRVLLRRHTLPEVPLLVLGKLWYVEPDVGAAPATVSR